MLTMRAQTFYEHEARGVCAINNISGKKLCYGNQTRAPSNITRNLISLPNNDPNYAARRIIYMKFVSMSILIANHVQLYKLKVIFAKLPKNTLFPYHVCMLINLSAELPIRARKENGPLHSCCGPGKNSLDQLTK